MTGGGLTPSHDPHGFGGVERRRAPRTIMPDAPAAATTPPAPVRQTVLWRSLPDGDLRLVTRSGDAEPVATPIERIHDAQLMPRAMTWHDGQLYLVVYDNPTLHNYLLRWRLGSDGRYTLQGQAQRLPQLRDPAGGTYEMIPGLNFVAHGSQLYLLGGTLQAAIGADGQVDETRIEGCQKIIEAIATPQGPAGLCQAPAPRESEFMVFGPDALARPALTSPGVPWRLHVTGESEQAALALDWARRPADFGRLLAYDLRRIQQSGWMEFGVDNTEGRIPWSQIYYLNGFLDILQLAGRDEVYRSQMAELLPGLRQRLDLEIALAAQHWQQGRYLTRAFTVDRSKALFAVQSSRLLLLLNRYLTELPDPRPIPGYAALRQQVAALDGHIEVLARDGEPEHWLAPGRAHLRWPKGSKFYYDGTAVPYNHQNEWAYSLLSTAAPGRSPQQAPELAASLDIIAYFLERISQDGALPGTGVWDYWWGTAMDGWRREDGVSENMPEFAGDKIKAWISFRSIDAMSALAASAHLPAMRRSRILDSATTLVAHGKLYPFVAYELARQGAVVRLSPTVARQYARVSSPWEIQNAAWAALYFSRAAAPLDLR